MIDVARVLCPIDFSDFSGHALEHAVTIARWYGARVTVLHVNTVWPRVDVISSLPRAPSMDMPFTEVDREGLRRAMQQFVDRVGTAGVSIELVLQDAPDVHREVLAQAEALGADLIVLGSHGRSGFERLVLGSIAEKVLRKASCPVLVVPRRAEGGVTTAQFKRILCPVDFSETSVAGLSYAMSLAKEADAHLTVMHVIAIPPELVSPPTADDFDVDRVRAAATAEYLRKLRELIPEAARTYSTVDTVVADGSPGRQILRVAGERGSDLIVMGARGRGAVDLLVFGSAAQHVVRYASCPVLVVHAPNGPKTRSSRGGPSVD